VTSSSSSSQASQRYSSPPLPLSFCPIHAPLSRPISASPATTTAVTAPLLHQLTKRCGLQCSNPLLSDAQDDNVSTSEHKIDIVEEDPQQQDESEEEDAEGDRSDRTRVSGYFFDHLSRLSGATRRVFNQHSIEWDDDRRSLRV